MKITVITCNQERHISLVRKLSDIADEVYVIHECKTIFPGESPNYMYYSDTMKAYFSMVMEAEKHYFGNISFLPSNVFQIPLLRGDLNSIPLNILNDALKSDYYIVFGSSVIKGHWIDFLVNNNAINIHMGTSPFYRGSACNFWAAYDKNPEYIGATIHLLSKGIDSGDILYHALPAPEKCNTIYLGMSAVRAAQESLVEYIKNNKIKGLKKEIQDNNKEIRFSRQKDFTDEIAKDYMNNLMKPEDVFDKLINRDNKQFKDAYIG